MSAAFMGIVLSVNLEFQLSSLLYAGTSSHHHPHEKLHQKIVSFLFLVIACPPAAMITWDVTCNHQEKVGSFMGNSYGSSVNQSVMVSGRRKVAPCVTDFLPPTGRRKFSFSEKWYPGRTGYGSPVLVRRIRSVLLWVCLQWDLGAISQKK